MTENNSSSGSISGEADKLAQQLKQGQSTRSLPELPWARDNDNDLFFDPPPPARSNDGALQPPIAGGTQDFRNMLHNMIGENHDDQSENDEIRNALADIEESEELGPAVGVLLAEAYNKTMTRPLSKENKDKLKNGLKIPENCSTFRVPKMNPEIWSRLPQKGRMADLKHQQLQQTLSLGMTVLVKMSEEISQKSSQIPKETLAKVFKIGLDGANLMGNQMQELNQKRKNEVKQYLSAEFSDICNAKIPVSEFLFGSNLTENLKATKAASAVMKTSVTQFRRPRPYFTPRAGNLNYHRPSTPFRGQWSGQQPQQWKSPRYTPAPRYNFQQSPRHQFPKHNFRNPK